MATIKARTVWTEKMKFIAECEGHAVHLSQTKFCAVSAMIVKSVSIHYTILLNGEEIGTGEVRF